VLLGDHFWPHGEAGAWIAELKMCNERISKLYPVYKHDERKLALKIMKCIPGSKIGKQPNVWNAFKSLWTPKIETKELLDDFIKQFEKEWK